MRFVAVFVRLPAANCKRRASGSMAQFTGECGTG
jgi:hypothetical protein